MLTRSRAMLVVVVSLQVCTLLVMLISSSEYCIDVTTRSTGRLNTNAAADTINEFSGAVPKQRNESTTETMARERQLRDFIDHAENQGGHYVSLEEGSDSNGFYRQAATDKNLEPNSSHEMNSTFTNPEEEHQEAASSKKTMFLMENKGRQYILEVITMEKPKTAVIPDNATRDEPKTATVSESKNRRVVLESSSESGRILGRVPDRIAIHGSDKVFVSIKSAHKNTQRLLPMMLTWLQTIAGKQVRIVTDESNDEDVMFAKQFGISVVPSQCPFGHDIEALCCKSGWEFEEYYTAVERGEDFNWFCHFDDDIYVNVQNLLALLKKYKHKENVYLGHYSRKWKRLPINNTFVKSYEAPSKRVNATKLYYALGPAYCISKELMTKLPPFFRGAKNFISTCVKTGLPDDASVGAIIDFVLGFRQFEAAVMMNELDYPERIRPAHFSKMVTYGYNRKHSLHIPTAAFGAEEDPSRFLSLHCLLHPETGWCPTPS